MTTVNRPGAADGHVCGIDAAMEVIGGKWKVLILWALHEHPHRRFGELRRLLPGVTEKVLASHLREMEADGIVRRVSYDEVPPCGVLADRGRQTAQRRAGAAGRLGA